VKVIKRSFDERKPRRKKESRRHRRHQKTEGIDPWLLIGRIFPTKKHGNSQESIGKVGRREPNTMRKRGEISKTKTVGVDGK